MTRVDRDKWVIEAGQRWTFHHSNRSTTAYIVEDVEDVRAPVTAAAAIVRLLNPATGRYAEVTIHWMQRPVTDGRSYWTLDRDQSNAA